MLKIYTSEMKNARENVLINSFRNLFLQMQLLQSQKRNLFGLCTRLFFKYKDVSIFHINN